MEENLKVLISIPQNFQEDVSVMKQEQDAIFKVEDRE